MIKYLLACITILCLSSSLNAQDQGKDSIYVIANWEVGDKQSYRVVEKKVKSTDGLVTESEEKLIYSTFEVLEENEDDYLLSYKKDSVLIPGNEIAGDNPIMRNVLNKLTYKFRTDYFGEYQSLENWEEIQANTISIMEDLANMMEEGEEKEQFDLVSEAVKSSFLEERFIESYMLKDIGAIFTNYGYIYLLGDTLLYEEQLPNILSGGLIPANGRFVAYMDNNELVYETLTNIDPEEGKKLVMAALKKMSTTMDLEEQEKEAEEFFKEANMSIEIYSKASYDLESGWLISLSQKRRVIVNDTTAVNEAVEEKTMTIIR